MGLGAHKRGRKEEKLRKKGKGRRRGRERDGESSLATAPERKGPLRLVCVEGDSTKQEGVLSGKRQPGP